MVRDLGAGALTEAGVPADPQVVADLAASFQVAAVDQLVTGLAAAADRTGGDHGGGGRRCRGQPRAARRGRGAIQRASRRDPALRPLHRQRRDDRGRRLAAAPRPRSGRARASTSIPRWRSARRFHPHERRRRPVPPALGDHRAVSRGDLLHRARGRGAASRPPRRVARRQRADGHRVAAAAGARRAGSGSPGDRSVELTDAGGRGGGDDRPPPSHRRALADRRPRARLGDRRPRGARAHPRHVGRRARPARRAARQADHLPARQRDPGSDARRRAAAWCASSTSPTASARGWRGSRRSPSTRRRSCSTSSTSAASSPASTSASWRARRPAWVLQAGSRRVPDRPEHRVGRLGGGTRGPLG